MIQKIVERIIAYSATQGITIKCVEFGEPQLPSPPYVVVKQEADITAGTAFRIIGHFEPGQQVTLRNYMITTIGQALDGFTATSATGEYNALTRRSTDMPSIIIPNDDGTISQERLYLMGNRA